MYCQYLYENNDLPLSLCREPEQMKLVLQHDGKNPIEPGFDHIVYYRNKIKKDIFYETAGLVGSHGEAWYDVRSKVHINSA